MGMIDKQDKIRNAINGICVRRYIINSLIECANECLDKGTDISRFIAEKPRIDIRKTDDISGENGRKRFKWEGGSFGFIIENGIVTKIGIPGICEVLYDFESDNELLYSLGKDAIPLIGLFDIVDFEEGCSVFVMRLSDFIKRWMDFSNSK